MASGNWMHRAFSKNKGALHRKLHVPMGHKIPAAKLAKASHSGSPKLRHEAQAAMNARRANGY